MKIIRRGHIQSKTKRFSCFHCGTVFEAEEGEYRNADQVAYVCEGIVAYCSCPVCGRRADCKGDRG